jgi:hypothetical protein
VQSLQIHPLPIVPEATSTPVTTFDGTLHLLRFIAPHEAGRVGPKAVDPSPSNARKIQCKVQS